MNIFGSSFSTTGSVTFGSAVVEIISWSDSQIVVEVSDVSAGTHDLLVETANGRAIDGYVLVLMLKFLFDRNARTI